MAVGLKPGRIADGPCTGAQNTTGGEQKYKPRYKCEHKRRRELEFEWIKLVSNKAGCVFCKKGLCIVPSSKCALFAVSLISIFRGTSGSKARAVQLKTITMQSFETTSAQ